MIKTTLELDKLYSNSKLISKYSSSKIIENYKSIYNIDVKEYFVSIPEVELRMEKTTGYQFFYPFTLAGNAAFYKDLQKISWYYADWKWEYDIALELIEKKKKVLEIGCGKGAFLNKLKEKCDCLGLELNDEAEEKNYEVTIINQTIESFAKKTSEVFDWVISFQVLEHIADINSFITNSLKVLKKDGKLLIAVPNNKAYFFNQTDIEIKNNEYLKTLLLNMPPHHMGKWDLKVFKEIQSIYDIELVFYKEQKVQEWRKELNKTLIINRFNSFLKKLIRKFINNNICYNVYSKIFSQLQYGDCIIVVFKKK